MPRLATSREAGRVAMLEDGDAGIATLNSCRCSVCCGCRRPVVGTLDAEPLAFFDFDLALGAAPSMADSSDVTESVLLSAPDADVTDSSCSSVVCDTWFFSDSCANAALSVT